MELHGSFAIYKGNEYKASKKKDNIILYSKDKETEKSGFTMNPTGTSYINVVAKEDVEKYYTKRLIGYYKKDFFEITEDDEEDYVIYSPEKNYSLLDMGFRQIGKGEYEKRVNKKEVQEVHFEYESIL
ncbi:MAG: hypothetical protein IJA34_09335 [Lachnospiraceae bacterium]|nr:hypothetical protein [Lachnospiraceae bacterium]